MNEQPDSPQSLSTPKTPTDAQTLIQLVHPLIPAVKEYLAGERKDKETNQMSVQLEYELRGKELDYAREESREMRSERRELRIAAIIISAIIGLILLVAVWKGQNATALEIIKLLAGILGPAFGAYWYGKAKRDRKSPKVDDDDDDE